MKNIVIPALIIAFNSCKNPQPESTTMPLDTVSTPVAIQPKEFKDVYHDFFYSIIDGSADQFDSFIHPEKGLYIIQSNGAMPNFTLVKSIANFRTLVDNKSFFELDRSKIGYEMIEDTLPKINCDMPPAFYTKEGAFTQQTNALENSGIWEIAKPEEQEQIKNQVSTIKMTVVNTANYRYYFSKEGDNWYISFIDMRKPCSA